MDLKDLFKVVEYDVHGTNPANTFKREKHYLKDKNLDYIVPDGSPYFGIPAKTKMYDEKGRILVLGRDYTMEDPEMNYGIEAGYPIKQYMKISREVLDNNEFVEIDYQSIGAFFLPRTKLDEIVDLVAKGNGLTPYDRITHTPDLFPPAHHYHSVKTEVADWYEIIWFLNYIANMIIAKPHVPLMDLDPVIDDAYSRLINYRDNIQARLASHDRNYNNPHGYTKEMFNLSNVQNFRFATLMEQLTTSSNTLYSSPYTVGELAKNFWFPKRDGITNGVLPFSKYNLAYVNNPVTEIVESSSSGDGYSLAINFNSNVFSMFKGTVYEMENGIKHFNIGPNRPSGGFYLYATVDMWNDNDTSIKGIYRLSPVKLCKSNRLLLIGRVYNIYNEEWRYDPNEATSYIADYAMSKVRDGGIIPVVTGNSNERGIFKFFRSNELVK